MHTLVLFGASGDLAREKLYPALYDLHRSGQEIRCLGFSRTPLATDAYRAIVRASVLKARGGEGSPAPEELDGFVARFDYVSGAYDRAGIAALAVALGGFAPDEAGRGRSYYLAIPVEYGLIRSIVDGLAKNGLIRPEDAIAVEKPFGFDGASAKRLNRLLGKHFTEEQIYRLDHYLAKGMVQDLFALRFANPIFEPVWNRKSIERIDISINETEGVRNRGRYYDRSGAIRDILQNHALQLLAFVTMDEPYNLAAASLHEQKLKILRRLRLRGEGLEHVHIGQYHGYRAEPFVDPASLTETYASLTLEIDTPRWRGVPITVSTGKKLGRKSTDIDILFRQKHFYLWKKAECQLEPNRIRVNIQPDNDIRLRLNSEFSFKERCALPVDLRFGFLDNAKRNPDPYENALGDFFHRNQSIFLNAREIASSWKLFDRLLAAIAPHRKSMLKTY